MEKKNPKTLDYYKEFLVGKKFGRLLVVSYSGKHKGTQIWNCLCDCGNTCTRRTENFIKGKDQSCRCWGKEKSAVAGVKHGYHKAKEYRTWHGIKQRCYNPKTTWFHIYGGKGVTMHESWRNDFMQFLKDMGFAPDKDSSIDRINSNGNYEPSNCRWATKTEQSNNTSRNRFLIVDGIRATMAEHARRLGVSRLLVKSRLTIGWGVEEAFKTPKMKANKCETTGRILPATKVTISN
jgi:hypothetical protein